MWFHDIDRPNPTPAIHFSGNRVYQARRSTRVPGQTASGVAIDWDRGLGLFGVSLLLAGKVASKTRSGHLRI